MCNVWTVHTEYCVTPHLLHWILFQLSAGFISLHNLVFYVFYFSSNLSRAWLLIESMTSLQLIPVENPILDLRWSEIGSKINQIKLQLDKTENLVRSLAEMKQKHETSLIIERQVCITSQWYSQWNGSCINVDGSSWEWGQWRWNRWRYSWESPLIISSSSHLAYLIELPTAIVLTIGTAVVTGVLFSLVTFIDNQVQCSNMTSTDVAIGALCSVLSQPLLLTQALVLGPILAFAVVMGIRIGEVEFLGTDNSDNES